MLPKKSRLIFLILSAACGLLAHPAWAQLAEPFQVVELGNGVSVVQIGERRTNVGLVAGASSDLVIDTYLASAAEDLANLIEAEFQAPARYVINTHAHGDHLGANAELAARGATIIAQENTRNLMLGPAWSIISERMMPAPPIAALPEIAVGESLTLYLDNTELQLFHLPHAHTGGDLAIYLPGANVLFAGDMLAIGYPTLIDAVTNGSLDGLIAAQQNMLQRINPDTHLVPGHGQIVGPQALAFSVQFLQAARSRLLADLADGQESNPAELLSQLPDVGQQNDPVRAAIFLEQAKLSLENL